MPLSARILFWLGDHPTIARAFVVGSVLLAFVIEEVPA